MRERALLCACIAAATALALAHPARAADCAAGRNTVAQADVFTHSGDVVMASALYQQGAKILGSCREAELASGDATLWLSDSETESYALRSAALLVLKTNEPTAAALTRSLFRVLGELCGNERYRSLPAAQYSRFEVTVRKFYSLAAQTGMSYVLPCGELSH